MIQKDLYRQRTIIELVASDTTKNKISEFKKGSAGIVRDLFVMQNEDFLSIEAMSFQKYDHGALVKLAKDVFKPTSMESYRVKLG